MAISTLTLVSMIVLMIGARLGETSKILVIPSGSFSHFLEMVPIANELLARKHEIHVLVETNQRERFQKVNAKYNIVTFKGSSLVKLDYDNTTAFFKPIDSFTNVFALTNEVTDICTSVMEDNSMWQQLQSLKFDLAIVDNFVIPCTFLIPYRLGIHYASCGTHIFPRYTNLPFVASVNQPAVGFETFGLNIFDEDGNSPRFLKVFRRFLEYAFLRLAMPEEHYLHKYVNFTTMDVVRLNVSLTITNLEHLLEDVPLPEMPNVVYAGGLTVQPARALPEDLHKWLNQSKCVALVNFGTRVANIDETKTLRLLDAFGRVRCSILFRCVDCQSLTVPANVRLAGWIPQNDVLAHENVKAFVTHSGNNGQYEALYHGVPMVAMYVDGDQLRNARRAERKGFGRRASLKAFEVDELAALMNDVIENGAYRRAIKKASEIFRSAEHPVVRAANAVEKVLKFGSVYENLITQEYYSPIEYYSLDVFFVLTTVLVVIAYIMIRLVFFVLSCIFKRFVA